MSRLTNLGLGTAAIGRPQYINIRSEANIPFSLSDFRQKGIAVLDNTPILERLAALKAMHNLRIGLTVTGDNQVEVLKRSLEVEMNGHFLFDVFQVTYNVFDPDHDSK